MKTIDIFHFDKEKSGNLLKKWLKNAGLSQHHAADLVGIHQDTLFNCISGRVQDIKFEIIFKIALITGHTVDDYIREMLDGEDVSFYCRAIPDPCPSDPAASPPSIDSHGNDPADLSFITRLYERQIAHLEKQLQALDRIHDRELSRLESILKHLMK